MIQDTLRSLPLDLTLYSNSLELVVFSSRKMLWRMITMILKPFTRHNKKTRPFLVPASTLLSKATANSDSQRLQKIPVLGELR